MINHPHRSKRATSPGPAPRAKAKPPRHDHDADWAALLTAVREAFIRATLVGGTLFETKTTDLADVFLDNIMGDEYQTHNCTACKSFLRHYGGLVTITENGHTTSVLWDEEAVPAFYRESVFELRRAVERAAVIGPFLSPLVQWGIPKTDIWTHMAVWAPKPYTHPLLTAGQAMAALRENFQTVERALHDFRAPHIAEAIRLLEAEHLPQSERFIAPLHWLANLHDKRAEASSKARKANVLWRAIATAPEGYCHPRASMTGTLLEDIAAGISFHEVKRRFTEKMHPLKYQRPQAAPKAGAIANAETVFAKMGLAPALERRWARLDEIQTAWAPFTPRLRPTSGGIFSHLAPKGSGRTARPSGEPAVTMTWEKFARVVLPAAEAIEAFVHGGSALMPFVSLTAPVNEDAPPILKWDRDDERNPFAWYLYHNGSKAQDWGIAGGWTKVNAIAPLPPMWGSAPMPHLGEGFILILDGAVDQRTGQGNALFPSCLRDELHAVRSVIEAYSRTATMAGRNQASASGLDIRKGALNIGYRLRVTVDGLQTDYTLDRWD